MASVVAVVLTASMATTALSLPPPEPTEPPGVRVNVYTNLSDGTFSFTSDIPGAAAFDITTEHRFGTVRFDAPPGTYTVTQLGPPAPFSFVDVLGAGCTPAGGQSFDVLVTAADTTTCIANNAETALVLTKQSIGGDGTFSFTSDIPGLAAFDITTVRGYGELVANVPPGTWTITELGPPAPFTYDDDSECPAGAAPQSIEVTVAANEVVKCPIFNEATTASITGPFVDGPFPAVTSPPLASLPPDGPTAGMGDPLPNGAQPPGSPELLTTFAGLSAETGASSSVLDPNGAVGPDHYVQAANSQFAVFDKTGGVLAGPLDLSALWVDAGGPCRQNDDGDPVVLYDQLADRWIISQFYLDPDYSDPPYGECIAVSRTPDPLGSYHLYTLGDYRPGDYPKIGVWDDGYFMTTQPNAGFRMADVAALDRDAMLAGQPTPIVRFTVNPTTFLLPADLDGTQLPPDDAPNWFTAFAGPQTPEGGPARLRVFGFEPDFATPAASTFALEAEVPISDFSLVCPEDANGWCVSQPPPGPDLDALEDVPQFRAAYRNFDGRQTIVATFAHGKGIPAAPVAASRWWELVNDDGDWTLHQEGDLSGGSLSRWVASAAQDRNGGLAVGYSVSDASTFPSIVAAARSPLDPLGTLGPAGVLIDGGGSSEAGGRWGDYSALTVDPVDDCTFWYTNAFYYETGEEPATAIGSFRRPDCAPVELSLTKTASPTTVLPGGRIDYTLTYANAAGDAAEVVLTETVPDGTTFAGPEGWSCALGAPAGTTCTLALGGLGPGEGGTATFSLQVDDTTVTGDIVNEAVLASGYGGEARATTTTPIVTPIAVVERGTPGPPVVQTLPATGTGADRMAAFALALVLVGAALVGTSRRRRGRAG